MCAQLSAQ
jgi:hypothetical protein